VFLFSALFVHESQTLDSALTSGYEPILVSLTVPSLTIGFWGN